FDHVKEWIEGDFPARLVEKSAKSDQHYGNMAQKRVAAERLDPFRRAPSHGFFVDDEPLRCKSAKHGPARSRWIRSDGMNFHPLAAKLRSNRVGAGEIDVEERQANGLQIALRREIDSHVDRQRHDHRKIIGLLD